MYVKNNFRQLPTAAVLQDVARFALHPILKPNGSQRLMPLHDCVHTFQMLSATVLPAHMKRLQAALADPLNMEAFARAGIGVKALLKEFKLPQDFSGCYVLQDQGTPIYVGISRCVFARLRQHVFGKTHHDASLAFRVATTRQSNQTIAMLTRSKAMSDPLFAASFKEAQQYLRSMQVAFIAIDNPLELYVFEPYCALELDTHQWNSFRTH